eukprot:TRINITY_DN8580_c3_g1_i7.p1 TRINITY_DN8580_c3_g1~~TRINITY_DN8580_c3_g1_i7.p1  ORF type:complete len:184 (-),score=7.68 TRINITY_DN8580_c3_g1_i7:205-756(-)
MVKIQLHHQPCTNRKVTIEAVSRRNFLFKHAITTTGIIFSAQEARGKQLGLDLASCTNYKQAGKGLQYCEVAQGTGESPLEGDLILLDYTARVGGSTGPVYDGSKAFKFTLGNQEVIPGWELAILGNENIPPIKQGGTRTVLIPPELAYNKEGYLCLFGRDRNCMVPPDTPVEITFKFVGYGY